MRRFPKVKLPLDPPEVAQAKKELREQKRKANLAETERTAAIFLQMADGYGLGIPVREYEFRTGRDSAFDFAWPAEKVALEVEGGIFAKQGHGAMVRIATDMEKYNAAAAAGWLVLRCVPGEKDVTRWRTSKRTGLHTPTPIYSVPGLCTFQNLANIRTAMQARRG